MQRYHTQNPKAAMKPPTIGPGGFSGLRHFGLLWLAESVVTVNNKKDWAITIREALREAPKKYRQGVARDLCVMIAREKQRQRFKQGIQ